MTSSTPARSSLCGASYSSPSAAASSSSERGDASSSQTRAAVSFSRWTSRDRGSTTIVSSSSFWYGSPGSRLKVIFPPFSVSVERPVDRSCAPDRRSGPAAATSFPHARPARPCPGPRPRARRGAPAGLDHQLVSALEPRRRLLGAERVGLLLAQERAELGDHLARVRRRHLARDLRAEVGGEPTEEDRRRRRAGETGLDRTHAGAKLNRDRQASLDRGAIGRERQEAPQQA